MIEPGLSKSVTLAVTEQHTAISMKSGDLPVFATPAMVALMEQAAMEAVMPILPEGATTVGCMIESTHLAPSAIGSEVTATAVLESVEGKKLLFKVEVKEGEKLLGSGKHVRIIVDRCKFMERLSSQPE